MTVYVCYWSPRPSTGNVGHISLWVDGGSPKGVQYLSRWPADLSAASLFSIGLGADNTYDQDVAIEGRKPVEVVLSKLDETAIKTAIRLAKKLPVYGFVYLNCASFVQLCLRAGIPTHATDVLKELIGLPFLPARLLAEHIAKISPPTVYLYAVSLKPDYG